jgi:hypothetical protein
VVHACKASDAAFPADAIFKRQVATLNMDFDAVALLSG